LVLFNYILYYLFPRLALGLMLVYWFIYAWGSPLDLSYELLFFLAISSVSVYRILGRGWSSNSKYAMLGAYRGMVQTISYEVSLSFVLMRVMCLTTSFNLGMFSMLQEKVIFIVFM